MLRWGRANHLGAPAWLYLLWLLLWGGLGGFFPERLTDPQSLLEFIHGVRAVLPIMAGWLALLVWLANRPGLWSPWSPPGLFVLYGLSGILASIVSSPIPLVGAYWAFAYLAVLLILRLFSTHVGWLRGLIRLNWAIAAILALVISAPLALANRSFYSIVDSVPSVAGIPMVRATGIARYAAVIGIVAFARLLFEPRRPRRLLWVLCLGFVGWVLWQAYSAGASLAFAVGAGVVLVTRRNVWILLATLSLGLLLAMGFHDQIWLHLMRGKDVTTLLSGRPEIWKTAWELVRDSPLLGWGFHADRLLLEWPYKSHISNAWLHAAVQSGLLGFLPFVAAWCLGASQLVHLLQKAQHLPGPDRIALVEVAGVSVFFAVRSIFESTGAFFGADWLFLAPLFAYLQALSRPQVVSVPVPSRAPARVLAPS